MIWARPTNALRHVEKLEARVTRIVAGFAASDVFWSSGCDPGRFLTNTSGSLIVPHMLWEVDSGDVIAVDEVDVGYGGAAPSRAFTLLGELGLSDPVARGIAYSRRSVTQLGCDGSTVLHSIAHADWPGFQLHTPTRIGASWVLRVTSNNLRNSVLQAGAPPRPGAGKIGQMIARELDRVDLPDWAHGRRTARLFDDCGAAQDAGFVDRCPQRSPVPDRPRTYRLIVEQGLLQLWFELPEPGEAGVLSREARDLIANLDISDGPR